MAFTNTVVNRVMRNGVIEESGTWALSGGSTSGTITPATSGQGINATIIDINQTYGAGSNTPSAALVVKLNSGRKTMLITSAANDTGTYFISGTAA